MNQEQIKEAAEDFISIYWNTEGTEEMEMLKKFPKHSQIEILKAVKEIDEHAYKTHASYFDKISEVGVNIDKPLSNDEIDKKK